MNNAEAAELITELLKIIDLYEGDEGTPGAHDKPIVQAMEFVEKWLGVVADGHAKRWE